MAIYSNSCSKLSFICFSRVESPDIATTLLSAGGILSTSSTGFIGSGYSLDLAFVNIESFLLILCAELLTK